MNLGLLPPLGGGLRTTASSGQVGRLLKHYLPRYVAAFDRVTYFSYHREALSEYTADDRLLSGVELIPRQGGGGHRLYALKLPWMARAQFEACHVLRVFQAVGALPALIARLRYGTPYVTTYGYRYHEFARVEGRMGSYVMLRLLEPLLLRRAAAVIVTTDELADTVSRLSPRTPIHLIPNGVDTRLFAPEESKEATTPSVLFVGRLTRQKNVPVLLRAMAAMERPARLTIVGDGPLRSELEQLARSLAVDCHFAGTVAQEEIPAAMHRASLFALPSLIEGHPKALIDAMSCGMACVASDCDGNRRLIRHGETGLLFASDDAGQLAEQIAHLLARPDLASALGRAARQQVLATLDIDALLAKEVRLLQEVGQSRPAAQSEHRR